MKSSNQPRSGSRTMGIKMITSSKLIFCNNFDNILDCVVTLVTDKLISFLFKTYRLYTVGELKDLTNRSFME